MCYLHLLITILANNQFYRNLDTLNTPYYSLTSTLRSLLKGTYIHKFLPLTFLLKSPIITNKYYTLSISLYKR